jgi:hypothetical protein
MLGYTVTRIALTGQYTEAAQIHATKLLDSKGTAAGISASLVLEY